MRKRANGAMTVHSVPEDAKAARLMQCIEWYVRGLMQLDYVPLTYLDRMDELTQSLRQAHDTRRTKICENSGILQLQHMWKDVIHSLKASNSLECEDLARLNQTCKNFYVMAQETRQTVHVLKHTYSKILPHYGGFDPYRLKGNILLFIGHCMSSPIAGSDPVVQIPPKCTLMTYCDYNNVMPIEVAFRTLKKITHEQRIPKTCGKYHIKANHDASPNYQIRGDDRFPDQVGIYVIQQKTDTKTGSVKLLQHCSDKDCGNLQRLFEFMEKLKCNHLVIIGCKN